MYEMCAVRIYNNGINFLYLNCIFSGTFTKTIRFKHLPKFLPSKTSQQKKYILKLHIPFLNYCNNI